MSSIVTEQGILHYESIGRGEPVILLHGWINSWDVWRDSMIALAKTGFYRVYALDFWGFGDSATGARTSSSSFQIVSYVQMVHQFMDTLGIQKTPIFGHSMGGTVALQMALDHPLSVSKVAVVGSPIVGTSLNPFLQLAGYGAIAKLVWRYPFILNSIMHILLARDSKKVRSMIFRDVQRTTLESFFRSIGDLRDTDLRQPLQGLEIPALGIYGRRDNIVSPINAQHLRQQVSAHEVKMMDHSRHFPMIDEPVLFMETLDAFLQNATETVAKEKGEEEIVQVTSASVYNYPNKMGRIILTAMEEILGRHGVNATLNLGHLYHLVNNYPPNNLAPEFAFADVSTIQQTLDEMYGERGGRGLALRAGRETWKYALKEFVPVLGIADLATRILPLGIKIQIGLDVFAETFNKFTDQRVRLGEDDRGYLWIIERCPICWQRQSVTPCCHLAVGLLEESLDWVSRGRHFAVEEVSCVATGDENCTIVISKDPGD